MSTPTFPDTVKDDIKERADPSETTTGATSVEAEPALAAGDSTEIKILPPVSAAAMFRFADRRDKQLMFIGSLAAVANGVSLPLFAVIFGNLMTAFNLTESEILDQVSRNSLWFVIIGIGAFISSLLGLWSWVFVSERLARKVRERYLYAVLRQDFAWHDRHKPGEVTARLSNDCAEYQRAVGEKVATGLQHTCTFTVGLIVGFSKGWQLAFVVLGVTPMIGIVFFLTAKLLASFTEKNQAAYAAAGNVVDEALSSLPTVVAFSGEQRELRRYEEQLEKAKTVGIKKGWMTGVNFGALAFAMFASYAICLWVGSVLIRHHVTNSITGDPWDGGQVMTVFFAILIGAMSLGQIGPPVQTFATGRAAAARLYEVIDAVPQIDSMPPWSDDLMRQVSQRLMNNDERAAARAATGAAASTAASAADAATAAASTANLVGKVLPDLRGDIELRSVSFRYPTRPEYRVFDGVSIQVRAGQTVALVGESGCGKSTIVGLLERFYDPEEGSITVDGTNLCDLNLQWWRSQVGLVNQEPILFDGTIYDNIAYGLTDATPERVEEACRTANAWQFIRNLPDRLQSRVGEGGAMLSGGQKQRIAIARALIRNPRIMLLDEATSALDNASERAVQRALDKLMGTRTTIVIAHRLSTIINADLIYVIDKGRVIESGTYNELVALGRAFAGMVRAQAMSHKIEIAAREGAPQLDQAAAGAAAAAGAGVTVTVTAPSTGASATTAVADSASLAASPDGVPEDDEEGEEDIDEDDRVSFASPAADKEKSGAIELIVVPTAAAMEDRDKAVSDGGRGRSVSGAAAAADPAATSATPADAAKVNPKKEGEDLDVEEVAPVPASRPLEFARDSWGWIFLGIIGAIGNGVTFPLWSIVFGRMVNVLFEADLAKQRRDSGLYALLFLAIGVGVLIAEMLQNGSFGVVGERITMRIRLATFRAMLRQEKGWHDEGVHNSRVLAARLSTDAALVHGATTAQWGVSTRLLSTIVAGVTIAFVHGWQLTLVVLASLPFMIVASTMQMKYLSGFTKAGDEALARSARLSGEAVANARTVAAFNAGTHVWRRYSESLDVPQQIGERGARTIGFSFAMSQLIIFCSYALSFWAGGKFVSGGYMSFQDMMTVVFAIVMTGMAMGQAMVAMPDVQKSGMARNRLYSVIDRASRIDASSDEGERASFERGAVNARDITFSYPTRPDREVLRGLSLDVLGGQTVALVGSSGCGKSTIVSLLLRLYDRTGGALTVDTHDVQRAHLPTLRSQMAIVQQEPVLFNTTIRENIRYGKPDATDAEVEAAARAANVHDVAQSFPDGYDTIVGPRGSRLSGGQKQRVAIARALVRNPRILLLDEATSALDTQSERVVQAALEGLMAARERTTIVIAHRLSTVQKADLIAVVDRGVVVELGTHHELQALNGIYAGLLQASVSAE